MIDANLLFILLLIFILLISESTLKRAFKENFRGCNSVSGCADCNTDYCGCNRNVVERMENYDVNQTSAADYLVNYELQIKQNCHADEIDTGDHCVKTGCSPGFEQGSGSGADICYPQCLPGYESNGMSRCFQQCPPGYETQDTKCIRPKHVYNKHTLPCNGCKQTRVLVTPQSRTLISKLVDNTEEPIMMGRYTGGYRYASSYDPVDSHYLHNLPYNPQYEMLSRYSVMENFDTPASKPTLPPQPPNSSATSSLPAPPSSLAPPAPAPLMSAPTNIVTPDSSTMISPTVNGIASTSALAKPTQPIKKTINPAIFPSDRDLDVPGDGAYCPYGYSLSGTMCYENCPPTYRDVDGITCSREAYVIDRPNYDRGGGVPFTRTRSKFARVFPGN